jgi:hypothetical protein
LEQAFKHYGRPEIFNTDQGSQFTAQAFVDAVKGQGCQLSMDGRGAWRDNVFVERLWRSVKYERVYLHACDSVSEARASIPDYFEWYNHQRPHSGLNRKTPHQAYLVGFSIDFDLAEHLAILLRPGANQVNGRFLRGFIQAAPPAFAVNRNDFAVGHIRQIGPPKPRNTRQIAHDQWPQTQHRMCRGKECR